MNVKRNIVYLCFIIAVFGNIAFAQQPSIDNSSAQKNHNEPTSIRVYMPDGQLKSHPVRVYVTKNISYDQKPQLCLFRKDAKNATSTESSEQETVSEVSVVAVAPNQEWTELINGQQTRQEGTLMLFDISSMRLGCKSP